MMDYLATLLTAHDVRGRVAEIGTNTGEGSTRILLAHAQTTGGEFYSIDTFPDEQTYCRVARQLDVPGAHVIRAYSVEAARRWTGSLAFLFVDGDHGFPHVTRDGHQTGVAVDILAWHRHIADGGILAFHDYHGTDTHYGKADLLAVEHAVDMFCHPPAYRWIGRQGPIVAMQKTGDHVLTPRFRPKIVPEAYREVWERLGCLAPTIATIVVYGTTESAKYVYDAILMRWAVPPEVVFTDSYVREEGRLFDGRRVVPFEPASLLPAVFVIGSVFEHEIEPRLRERGLAPLEHYFGMHEFVGWCHVG